MSNYLKQNVNYQGKACQYCKLANICLPKGCVNNDLIAISKLVNNNYLLQAGESICFSGESFHYLYAIRSGSAKDSTIALNGNEEVADFYLPGEIIGLDAISTGKYAFEARTLETSSICIIPFDKLLLLAARIPRLQYHLMHLISQKLLDRTHVLINNHHNAEQRVAAFLINITDRYQRMGLLSKNYYLSMSRYDIGSYLNLTPETVSRMFTKFQDDGILIAHKKHVQVINKFKLMTRC